jgi:hypothetical protein
MAYEKLGTESGQRHQWKEGLEGEREHPAIREERGSVMR